MNHNYALSRSLPRYRIIPKAILKPISRTYLIFWATNSVDNKNIKEWKDFPKGTCLGNILPPRSFLLCEVLVELIGTSKDFPAIQAWTQGVLHEHVGTSLGDITSFWAVDKIDMVEKLTFCHRMPSDFLLTPCL